MAKGKPSSTCLIRLFVFIKHLYKSGAWLDVAWRIIIEKAHVLVEIGLHVHDKINHFGFNSRCNGGGIHVWSIKEHKHLQFVNE